MIPNFQEARRHFERAYVRRVMRAAEGNITVAARIAAKDRKDFYELAKRCGVDLTELRLRVQLDKCLA